MNDAEYIGRLLVWIANADRRLRDGLGPAAPGAGGGAGGGSTRPGSKPPLNIGVLDTCVEAHRSIAGWAGNLASDIVELFDVSPEDKSMSAPWARARYQTAHEVADWLFPLRFTLAERPWADDMIAELQGHLDCMEALLPAATDPTPLPTPTREVDDAVAARTVTATQAVTVLAALGYPVTTDQIRMWRNRGKVNGRGYNNAGRVLYRVGDLVGVASAQTIGRGMGGAPS